VPRDNVGGKRLDLRGNDAGGRKTGQYQESSHDKQAPSRFTQLR
jgi:hypothetical protein